jgi:DNA-binding SARP family transcriptional activator/pimeloyl-ACP methyl ester carboxylesterase
MLQGETGTIAVAGTKARQLITVLALAAPEALTLDRLIDTLWSDPPPAAAKTVQAHLSRLRTALAHAGAPGAIMGGAAGYRLDLGQRVDVDELRRLTRRADAARAGGDHDAAAELFGQARRLWRGEPELPDTAAGSALRRRIDDQRRELAVGHLGSLIAAGAADQAAAELAELVVSDPLDERLWELRILALYRSGRPTEALRAFGDVRARLAEEVGVLPGAALRELEAAILAHRDVGPAPPARPAPTARAATDVAYVNVAGRHLAYRTFGSGSTPVLLLNPGLISIDTLLEEPHMARAIDRLAEDRCVVVFDPRGVGLSDRTQPPDTIDVDDWVADAVAVLDALGLDAVHVFAGGHGGLVGIRLSAAHGDRVRSLTLFNAFARFTRGDGYPHGPDPEVFAGIQASMQSADRAPGVDALTLISPSVAADPDYRAWWDSAGRRAASPAAAAVLVSTMVRADVRHSVAAIDVPTLVIIRRGCMFYDAAHGEYLAEHLGDVVVERHDDVNEPWWIGDTDLVVGAFERFLGAPR